MLFKSSSLLVALTIVARLASATTPPACLLAAVGAQEAPSDLNAVCGNATIVESALSSGCSSNLATAMSAFSSICSVAGDAICEYLACYITVCDISLTVCEQRPLPVPLLHEPRLAQARLHTLDPRALRAVPAIRNPALTLLPLPRMHHQRVVLRRRHPRAVLVGLNSAHWECWLRSQES